MGETYASEFPCLPAVGLGGREAGPAGTETAQDISLEHGARVHLPGLERKFAKSVSTQNQPPHLRGIKEETGDSVTEEKARGGPSALRSGRSGKEWLIPSPL